LTELVGNFLKRYYLRGNGWYLLIELIESYICLFGKTNYTVSRIRITMNYYEYLSVYLFCVFSQEIWLLIFFPSLGFVGARLQPTHSLFSVFPLHFGQYRHTISPSACLFPVPWFCRGVFAATISVFLCFSSHFGRYRHTISPFAKILPFLETARRALSTYTIFRH